MRLKYALLAATVLAAATLPAKAGFVLNDNVFADLGATGFGNAPRLLTLQNFPLENGAVVSNGGATQFLNDITIGPSPAFNVTGTVCTSNGACTTGLRTGANESTLVNVTALWPTGATVGVGLDTNQTGSTGALLFSELVLNIYTAAGTKIGTFGGNDPVLISEAQLALQQGNGNSVFNLQLTPAEQAEYNAMLALLAPGAQVFAGLAAQFGCTPAPCIGASNDGADSFLAFRQVPGPMAGAGLPGIVSACFGLWFMAKRRRNRLTGGLRREA
jgi:hypothetical protein